MNYLDDVVEIAELVCQRRLDITFVIIGDGDQGERLEGRCGSLGLADVVHWKGYRPREEVRYWRGISDVQLCLMGGFSLLEAAASARPVIAYDVEWHGEVIRDRETGVLLKEHDIHGAAAAIEELLADRAWAATLGQRARRLVAERYTERQASERRVACYEELLRGQRLAR